MQRSILLAFTVLVFIFASAAAPKAGEGDIIWKHDFSNGMPAAFDHSASYPNSGTWGRYHDLSGGNVYEPASISGSQLRVKGPSCAARGVAYPRGLKNDLKNWEFYYRVDPAPGSTGHGDRDTGGMRAGAYPQGNYNDDISSLYKYGVSFTDYGDSLVLRHPAGGVTLNSNLSISAGSSQEYYVRISTSWQKNTTWIKYWKTGENEPEDWIFKVENRSFKGIPGGFAVGTCKGNSRSNYYSFYEIRKLSTERFCDFRGLSNECIMNQTRNLDPGKYNVSAFFWSQQSAVLKSTAGTSTLNITNSTSISGLWEGSLFIDTERPIIAPGARFRPQNGDIVIGD